MMKKLLAIVLAIALVFALSVAASAQNSTITNTTSPSATAVISTTIDSTYTVTIPGSTTVDFNKTVSNFGTIALSNARLEPNSYLRVTLNASGELKTTAVNSDAKISYAIKDDKGNPFSYIDLDSNGDSALLKIHIDQTAWNAAAAGIYNDTVNFTISYVKPTAGGSNP